MSTRPSWPWLTIPDAAQPGQPHAFADREPQLRALYRALVHAGNAVREGKSNIRHKHLVHGYKGVGKSALIMQALGLLRGEITIKDPGQHTDIDEASLLAPRDPQRWLIFHLSGKHIANIEALGDQLAITSREALEENTNTTTLDLALTIHKTADKELPRVGSRGGWHLARAMIRGPHGGHCGLAPTRQAPGAVVAPATQGRRSGSQRSRRRRSGRRPGVAQ